MITKELLDQALEVWALARDRLVLEQAVWGNVLKSHDLLIASLRANGHSWSQAQNEFKKISDAHSRTLTAAWNDRDVRCEEYQILLKEFNLQSASA